MTIWPFMRRQPHDPDPPYQSGMRLLELGAYTKARESFEEVERVAPGWFRSRTVAGPGARDFSILE